jgi:hypothetical protein
MKVSESKNSTIIPEEQLQVAAKAGVFYYPPTASSTFATKIQRHYGYYLGTNFLHV